MTGLKTRFLATVGGVASPIAAPPASRAQRLRLLVTSISRLMVMAMLGATLAACNAPRTSVDVEGPPPLETASIPVDETAAGDSASEQSTGDVSEPLTQSPTPTSQSPATTMTGMLIAIDEQQPCQTAGTCGPAFSLYDESFGQRVVLLGDVDAANDGLIVTVSGQASEVEVPRAGQVGATETLKAITATDIETLSTIAYQPFLVRMADEFVDKTFGCTVLWDRQFTWHLDKAQSQLRVRLSEFTNDGPSGRWVEAWYDGRDGEFIRFLAQPSDLNPCRKQS